MSTRMTVTVSEDPRPTVVVTEDVITVVSVGIQGPAGPQGPPGDADMTIYDAHLADSTDVHGIADTAQVATLADLEPLPTTTTGDLIVHGATEPIRLPVGAEGEALQVVSGVPAWGALASGGGGVGAIGLPLRSNAYYSVQSVLPFQGPGANAWVTNRIDVHPFPVPNDIVIDRLGINVTVASGAGGVARLGLYAHGVDGMPGDLMVDAGEVSVSTTGVKEIILDTPIACSAGDVIWLALLVGTSAPSISTTSASSLWYGLGASAIPASALRDMGYNRSYAYSPLPATYGVPAATGAVLPAIYVRTV